MLLWALYDVVMYTFYIYTSSKIQLLNHSIIYKSWLYKCISDKTTSWCSDIYVDILFSSRGLGYILHKHSPQQVVYLLYPSPDHGLHIIYAIIVIIIIVHCISNDNHNE